MARTDDDKDQIIERLDILIRLLGYQVVMGHRTLETKALTLNSAGLIPTEIARICGRPIRPIKEVADSLGMKLPGELASFFDESKIHTIEDIRRAGGLGRLESLPLKMDDPTVKMLDAQVNLSALFTTVEENAVLITNGYLDINSIAAISVNEFVSGISEDLEELKAAQVHAAARSQQRLLDSVLAGIGTDIANGQVPM